MDGLIVKPLISYTSVFSRKPNEALEELLKNIPSDPAIKWISYIHFLVKTRSVDEQEHQLFMSLLFSLDKELQTTLISFLQRINILNYVFWDETVLMRLTEKLLERRNKRQEELTKRDYSNLIKAYLICCDEHLKHNHKALSDIVDIDSFVKIYLPERMKTNDIEYPKDYRVEFIRFYMFMRFCEVDTKFNGFLKLFLAEYNIKYWDHYLYFIFDLHGLMQTNKEGKTNVFYVEPMSYATNYLRTMSITDEKFIPSIDFTGIRERPMYYLGDNAYCVLSLNFFVDKMFQSFLFDFATILTKRREETNITGYPSLKKIVGEVFTEKVLFYNIMNDCFAKWHDTALSGDDLSKYLEDREPDFYLRKSNDIFLFEFKDVMLNASIKHSDNYEQIESELLELFELSTKEKSTGKKRKVPNSKGITQLLNVIECKMSSILSNVDSETKNQYNIYPIIVYQDNSFDIEGVNYILNKRFQLLKNNRDIPQNFVVHELVMISLPTMIKLEDYFCSGQFKLGTIINEYISLKRTSPMNMAVPFNKFIMQKAFSEGYKNGKTKRFDSLIAELVIQEKQRK